MSFPLRTKPEEGAPKSHTSGVYSANVFNQPLPPQPKEEEKPQLWSDDVEQEQRSPPGVVDANEDDTTKDEPPTAGGGGGGGGKTISPKIAPQSDGDKRERSPEENSETPQLRKKIDSGVTGSYFSVRSPPKGAAGRGANNAASPFHRPASFLRLPLRSSEETAEDEAEEQEEDDGSRTTDEAPEFDADGNEVQREKKESRTKTDKKKDYLNYIPNPVYDVSDIPKYATSRRAENLRKLIDKEAPPYVIPHYEQACFKYIFREAFDEGLDGAEIQALGGLIISSLINVSVVSLNVFGTNSETKSKVVSTDVMTQIVFIVEFAIVVGLLLVSFATVLEGIIRRSISTDTAIDFVELSMLIGSFSTLQVVNVVSPNVVVNKILPEFTTARTLYDHIKAVITAVIWLILCVLACLAVVLKVSQVGFVSTVPIDQWNLAQIAKMLGLVLNLAKVDQSYEAELSTSLKALHHHYSGPGGPDSRNPKSEGFYSKALQYMGIERKNSYEYFEAVFNHHFGDGNPEDLTFGQQVRKTLNFGAFIAQLNPLLLFKYLQMTRSPLPHYVLQRQEFTDKRVMGILENRAQDVFPNRPEDARHSGEGGGLPVKKTAVDDAVLAEQGELQQEDPLLQVVEAMETAIKQADPDGDDILDQGISDPRLFRLTFICEDEDEDYTAQGVNFDLEVEGLDQRGISNPASAPSSPQQYGQHLSNFPRSRSFESGSSGSLQQSGMALGGASDPHALVAPTAGQDRSEPVVVPVAGGGNVAGSFEGPSSRQNTQAPLTESPPTSPPRPQSKVKLPAPGGDK